MNQRTNLSMSLPNFGIFLLIDGLINLTLSQNFLTVGVDAVH